MSCLGVGVSLKATKQTLNARRCPAVLIGSGSSQYVGYVNDVML